MFDSPERGPWGLDKGWGGSDGGVCAFGNGAEGWVQGVGLVAGVQATNVIKAHVQGPFTQIWFGQLKCSQKCSPDSFFFFTQKMGGKGATKFINDLPSLPDQKGRNSFIFFNTTSVVAHYK